ncbi:hypothetical protein ABTM57_20400, partial [Acinetobacter baumannii]
HLTEQSLRILAGAALIVRSPIARLPTAFEAAGICIVASSVMIRVLPMRFHASYGHWCIRWLSPLVIRLACPVPAIVGAGIVWA